MVYDKRCTLEIVVNKLNERIKTLYTNITLHTQKHANNNKHMAMEQHRKNESPKKYN
jgi:hypothetical protein